MSGKGDTYRPVDQEKYGSNYDRIFQKPKSPIDQLEPGSYYIELDGGADRLRLSAGSKVGYLTGITISTPAEDT